jgi:hypothetical protein
MTPPTNLEGLIARLRGHAVYHRAQSAGQGFSPLSTATGHTQLAMVLDEAADALEAQSTLLAEMAEGLRECAVDLEAEVMAREDCELPRRISRDLEPVERARSLLSRYDASMKETDRG